MAPSNGGSASAAMLVASSFARQYYHFLKKDPSQLYKMYSEHSLFSRADEADDLDAFGSHAGTDAIHEAIMATAGGVTKVEIASLKAQESQDGVVALLTGSISFADGDCKRFVQTLFLKRQRDGTYVAVNDMVKYIEVYAEPYVEPTMEPVKSPAWEPVQQPSYEQPSYEQPSYEEPMIPVQPPPPAPVEEPAPVVAVPEVPVEPEAVAAAPVQEEPAAESVPEPVYPEEQPKSWASMANRLKQGGGMLGPSKVQGFSMPAGLPPAGTHTRAQAPPAKPTVTAPAAAPAEGKKEEATTPAPAATSNHVRLWVSRLPADRSYGGKDVIDSLNQLLVGEGLPSGRVTDARIKDSSEWGSVMAANQEVADMIVQFSKDRKIVVQGASLKLELDKGQEKATKSSGKGRGKAGKGEKGDAKGSEGKGSGRKGKSSSKGGGNQGGGSAE